MLFSSLFKKITDLFPRQFLFSLLVAVVLSASIYPASTFKVDQVVKTSDLSSIPIPSFQIIDAGNDDVKPKIEYDFLPFISAPPLANSAEAISASAESEEPNQFGIVESDESEEELLPLLSNATAPAKVNLLPALPVAPTAIAK